MQCTADSMKVSPTDKEHWMKHPVFGWVHSIDGTEPATDWHTIMGSPLAGKYPDWHLIGLENTSGLAGLAPGLLGRTPGLANVRLDRQ